jgi:hypothetical protein
LARAASAGVVLVAGDVRADGGLRQAVTRVPGVAARDDAERGLQILLQFRFL